MTLENGAGFPHGGVDKISPVVVGSQVFADGGNGATGILLQLNSGDVLSRASGT